MVPVSLREPARRLQLSISSATAPSCSRSDNSIKEVIKSGDAHGVPRGDLFGCLYFHVADQPHAFAERRTSFDLTLSAFTARTRQGNRAGRVRNARRTRKHALRPHPERPTPWTLSTSASYYGPPKPWYMAVCKQDAGTEQVGRQKPGARPIALALDACSYKLISPNYVLEEIAPATTKARGSPFPLAL